jgi:protein-disulfide isomerase
MQQQQNKYIGAALVVSALGILVLQPAMTFAQLSPNESNSSNTSSSLSGQDNNTALNSTQAITNASNRFSLQSLKGEGAPILGNESAPVIIIDFSDFQCPRCERYVQSTEPEIKKEYIETGNVIYVFKQFP